MQQDFAGWLSRALGGRPNTYLVERSGTKLNGRPRIDGSRVHSWLKGERPSFALAELAARALGRPPEEALRAAGYEVKAPADPVAQGLDPSDLVALRRAVEESTSLDDGTRAAMIALIDVAERRRTA